MNRVQSLNLVASRCNSNHIPLRDLQAEINSTTSTVYVERISQASRRAQISTDTERLRTQVDTYTNGITSLTLVTALSLHKRSIRVA